MSCAFGLIFVYGLLYISSFVASFLHTLLFVSFQQKKDFWTDRCDF